MYNSKVARKKYLAYLLVFLGFMSAFGPFVTDMYLPTLPSMAAEFAVSVSEIQAGITASLLGLAIGQIFFGPLSDRLGRKPIIFWSLVVFIIATIGDIYSNNIAVFNVFRFFQGIGGAGGIVLSRSVATDCYDGKQLAKTMAIIGAINGIAPVSAPVLGGFVGAAYGWEGVFVVLLGIGIALLIMSVPFTESLPPTMRLKVGAKQLYGNFFKLIRNRPFMMCILVFSFANGVLFSYIASAPFIIQNIYGISDKIFSIIFAINALAIVGGSALSLKFKTLKLSITTGGVVIFIMTLMLLVNALTIRNFMVYEAGAWGSLLGVGFIFPAVTTIAMNHGRFATGAASALVGAVGFAAGGIVSPFCGIGDILLSSSIIMLACGIFLLFFSKKIA